VPVVAEEDGSCLTFTPVVVAAAVVSKRLPWQSPPDRYSITQLDQEGQEAPRPQVQPARIQHSAEMAIPLLPMAVPAEAWDKHQIMVSAVPGVKDLLQVLERPCPQPLPVVPGQQAVAVPLQVQLQQQGPAVAVVQVIPETVIPEWEDLILSAVPAVPGLPPGMPVVAVQVPFQLLRPVCQVPVRAVVAAVSAISSWLTPQPVVTVVMVSWQCFGPVSRLIPPTLALPRLPALRSARVQVTQLR